MLFIIEIVLTVLAWRKGWKWLSLLPLGIGFLIGFLIGLSVGTNGGNISSVQGISLVLDIIIIIILGIMTAKSPKIKEIKS